MFFFSPVTDIVCLTIFLTQYLSHFMGRSPSREANNYAASYEIPRLLRNLTIHYRLH
jgi:hypothetical protein